MGNINRNAPCPCGSGKKYKKCCMGSARVLAAAPVEPGPLDWGKPSQGRPQDNDLDRFITQGHDQLDKQNHKEACEAWAPVWDQLLLRLTPAMTSCAETLSVYDGSFFLCDWLQDYCAALHNAALDDVEFAKTGASFCNMVLLQFTQEKELILENFQASLGEFYYMSGQQDKGEKVLLDLIASRPHRSVGYAYLSDMLGDKRFNLKQDHPFDLDRAIAILQQALAYPVEDAPDYDLEKRLRFFKEDKEG